MMDNQKVNRLIAENVMGWPTTHFKNIDVIESYTNDKKLIIGEDFSPATNINDAWMVVDKFRESKVFHLHEMWDEEDNKMFSANFEYNDSYHVVHHEGIAVSAPLAICKSALKVVGVNID